MTLYISVKRVFCVDFAGHVLQVDVSVEKWGGVPTPMNASINKTKLMCEVRYEKAHKPGGQYE